MNYGQVRDYALQLVSQYSIGGTDIPLDYNGQADYYNKIASLVEDAQTYIATTVRPILAYVDTRDLEASRLGGFIKYTMPDDCFRLSSRGIYQFVGENKRRYHRYSQLGEKEILIPVTEALQGSFLVEYYRYPRPLARDNIGREVFTAEDEQTKFQLKYRSQSQYPLELRAVWVNGVATKAYGYQNDIGTITLRTAAEEGDVIQVFWDDAVGVSDFEELDNEPETHGVVAFYVAAQLVQYDDSFRYSALKNEFETRLSRLGEARNATYEKVENVYDADPYNGWDVGVWSAD